MGRPIRASLRGRGRCQEAGNRLTAQMELADKPRGCTVLSEDAWTPCP